MKHIPIVLGIYVFNCYFSEPESDSSYGGKKKSTNKRRKNKPKASPAKKKKKITGDSKSKKHITPPAVSIMWLLMKTPSLETIF